MNCFLIVLMMVCSFLLQSSAPPEESIRLNTDKIVKITAFFECDECPPIANLSFIKLKEKKEDQIAFTLFEGEILITVVAPVSIHQDYNNFSVQIFMHESLVKQMFNQRFSVMVWTETYWCYWWTDGFQLPKGCPPGGLLLHLGKMEKYSS